MDDQQNPLPPYPPTDQAPVAPQPSTPRIEHLPELPKQGLKKIWIIIIAIVVVGGIGFGSYTYANNKATKEKNDLQAKIDAANDKVNELTTTVSQMNTNLNTNTAVISNTNTNTAIDPTADWKTYTGNNFSVKYPSTWTAKQYGATNEAGLYSTVSPINDASGVAQPNIIIMSPKSFDDYTKVNTQTIIVDGVTGYWAYMKDATTVFFQKNTTFYEVTFESNLTYDKLPQEQKTILSTLKFTS